MRDHQPLRQFRSRRFGETALSHPDLSGTSGQGMHTMGLLHRTRQRWFAVWISY